jgi:FSR family fosmidomycin resistance protein-like MFS transporter
MALIGLGYFLVSVSPTLSLIMVALLIASAGSALWHPPALGLLSQRFPARRGLFISLHRSTGNVGDMVGPLIAGGLLAWLSFSGSWRWIMGGGTPMLMLLALLILLLLWNVAGPQSASGDFRARFKTQLRSLRGAFQGKGMWAIFTVPAVRGMADRSVIFFLPFYLREQLGMSFVLVAVHVTLIAAPGIVSGPLFGMLSNRIGRRSIITFVMAVTCILPLVLILAGSNVIFTLTVITVFGLFHSIVNSLTQAAAIDEAAGCGLDATFIGLMWGSNAFFGAGAAVFAAALVELYTWTAAFYFAAILFFVGFLASLIMPRPALPQPRAAVA